MCCRFFRYQHPGARNYQFDQLRYDRHLFCPLFYRWLFTVCSSICCNRKCSGTAGRHSAVHDSDYAFDGVQLYAGIYSMNNPDGPLAFWCSMIPFTSPIVMMVRLPFDIPVWELALSFALLFTTAILIIWFSAKIYRVGILMYGKKPSIKEMIKWVKYK